MESIQLQQPSIKSYEHFIVFAKIITIFMIFLSPFWEPTHSYCCFTIAYSFSLFILYFSYLIFPIFAFLFFQLSVFFSRFHFVFFIFRFSFFDFQFSFSYFVFRFLFFDCVFCFFFFVFRFSFFCFALSFCARRALLAGPRLIWRGVLYIIF